MILYQCFLFLFLKTFKINGKENFILLSPKNWLKKKLEPVGKMLEDKRYWRYDVESKIAPKPPPPPPPRDISAGDMKSYETTEGRGKSSKYWVGD